MFVVGVCFIETKNLDGETTLKSKLVSKLAGSRFKTVHEVLIVGIRLGE